MTQEINLKIKEKIAASERILIVSHVRPDADAAGSLLGLGLALEKAGKTVQMVLQDGADRFEYLPGSEKVLRKAEGDFDMIVVVDCSDPDRVGNALEGYGSPDLVVDHHKTNLNFGSLNVVEPEQVATAAILYDYLPEWGLTIDAESANALLAGLIGDTIGFRTSNVDAAVLQRAAALMEFGADLFHIYREELVLKSFKAVRYWGAGLSNLMQDDGLVWASLTLADREKIGYAGNDDADLVNVLSAVREAKIALIFIEQENNQVKVSWRARPGLDVSGIAFSFGGGGHAAAAGADIDGDLEDIMTRVIGKTRELLESSRN
jgi:phosphoesterase RecJ-like protein